MGTIHQRTMKLPTILISVHAIENHEYKQVCMKNIFIATKKRIVRLPCTLDRVAHSLTLSCVVLVQLSLDLV